MSVGKLVSSEFKSRVLSMDGKLKIVKFWAPWCGPCNSFAPTVDKLAEQVVHVDFFAVNVDECQDVANEYMVRGIPMCIAFRNGKKVGDITGAQTASNMNAWISKMENAA